MFGVLLVIFMLFSTLGVIGFGSTVSGINVFTSLTIVYTFLWNRICPYKVLSVLRTLTRWLFIFCDITFQYSAFLFYYFASFSGWILNILCHLNPFFYQCVSFIINFSSWMLLKIIEGIFLQSDSMTVLLSYLVIVCLFLSYINTKYCVKKPYRGDNPLPQNQNITESQITIEELVQGIRSLRRPRPRFTNVRQRGAANIRNAQSQNGQTASTGQHSRFILRNNDINPSTQAQCAPARRSSNEHILSEDSSDIDEEEIYSDAQDSMSDENCLLIPAHSLNLSECSICMREKRNAAVFPCGHTVFCVDCVRKVMTASKKCPLCTVPIQDYRIVFL